MPPPTSAVEVPLRTAHATLPAAKLAHEGLPKPVAVRYGWADNATCNLCNGAGLPAIPFRSDNWPGITETQRPY